MISLEFHCDICPKDFAFKRGLGRYIGNVHEVLVFRNFGLFSYLFWFTLKFPWFIFMNCFMKFNFVGTHNRLHILKFISWFPIWLINRFNSFDLWSSFEKWLYIVNWPLAITDASTLDFLAICSGSQNLAGSFFFSIWSIW